MRKSLALVSIVFLFFGCSVDGSGDFSEDSHDDLSIVNSEECTELFTRDNNQYIIETNSERFITENGYTIWTCPHTNQGSTFNSLSVNVSKESGNSDAGYGVVFCKNDTESGQLLLSVLINTKSQYMIGKYKNDEFIPITNWKGSVRLRSGYAIKNNIEIKYLESTKEFQLSFNNVKETTFSVDEDIKFAGSGYGYVAVISNREKFPKKTVRVVFEDL